MNTEEFKELLINVVGSINTGKIKIADHKIVRNDKDLDMSKASIKVRFTIKNCDYGNSKNSNNMHIGEKEGCVDTVNTGKGERKYKKFKTCDFHSVFGDISDIENCEDCIIEENAREKPW